MRGSSINSFASTRAFREGSVGLLILLGLGVFGIVILWLNRLTAAGNSYKAIVEFKNAGGMQKGAIVRFRGVKVGNIAQVSPKPDNVEVVIEINNPNLIIPKDSRIEANQSGFISESIIEITPNSSLPPNKKFGKPSEENCNKKLIVCDGSRLTGGIGTSIDDLVRSSSRLSSLYSQPEFYTNVNDALKNTSQAAEQLASIGKDISKFLRTSQQDLDTLSSAADSVASASKEVTESTNEAIEEFGSTADDISSVAKDISLTTKQVSGLLDNINSLVATNRSSLVTTLDNITQTSTQLRLTVDSLSPTIKRLNQGELVQNLENLSANASEASANLRDVTKTLNEPNNLLVLQQTLDSARVTFENTQKITSDLDELTGDPAFRQDLKELVGGLSGLVSSTQEIEQQVQLATKLESVKTALQNSKTSVPTASVNQKKELPPPPKISIKATESETDKEDLNKKTSPSSSTNLRELLREHRKTSLEGK